MSINKESVRKVLNVEHAVVLPRFRNFSGKAGKYNAAGARNFNVFLDHEDALALKDEGWNIKFLEPREEGDLPQAMLKVNVKFGDFPPRMVLITGQGKTNLEEDSVDLLDWADLENIDLVITPYFWDVDGNQGITAYLKAGYFTLREDNFASKYYDVPDSALSSLDVE